MVSVRPLLLTQKDDELLGMANRSDGMGVLAVWSDRARDLVPALTEQTTQVRGFQVLVEAFRLWQHYEPAHPQHAGRVDDFFLLVEQAFARTVGSRDKEWPLPGARRVRARAWEIPYVSLAELDWHLLGGQKANGVWGLYRGAAWRAGLLYDDAKQLSSETSTQAALHPGLTPKAQKRLFGLVERAMDGETVELPTRLNNQLAGDLYEAFHAVPLAAHLQERLIDSRELNSELARRLRRVQRLDRRRFLTKAVQQLPEHRTALDNAIRCETFLAIVEGVFYWLCANKGKSVETVMADIPVDLEALAAARNDFANSGLYRGETASSRHERFFKQLDTSSAATLGRTVLSLHQSVCEERHRATWVWEDHGLLRSDVDIDQPSELALLVGEAWRNDYYLFPLKNIADQLEEVQR